VPTVHDLEKLRRDTSLINFKDLQESIIPKQKIDLVNLKNDEFEIFGEVNQVMKIKKQTAEIIPETPNFGSNLIK
jgi:hypothetical protein